MPIWVSLPRWGRRRRGGDIFVRNGDARDNTRGDPHECCEPRKPLTPIDALNHIVQESN